ncbi:MAG: hypothetical protein ABR975_02030 [Vulcanimicrobiaceae bacterium]|jgi:hypothetical protein
MSESRRSLLATALVCSVLLVLPVTAVVASFLVRDALAPIAEDAGQATPAKRDDLPFGFVV